jgi:hypothetical protein
VSALRNRLENDKQIVYFDIDYTWNHSPTANDVCLHNLDFFSYSSESKTIVTITNPPFGKNASLAVRFFNHAAIFSGIIAFIVPKSFRKHSIQNRLDANFVLLHEHALDKNSFIFNDDTYDVPCVFQIWKRSDIPRLLVKKELSTDDFVFCERSIAKFAIRRVGVNAGRIYTEDIDTRSISSHLFIQCKTDSDNVLKNLRRLNLEQSAFKYDTAGCPSISKNDLCIAYNKNKLFFY